MHAHSEMWERRVQCEQQQHRSRFVPCTLHTRAPLLRGGASVVAGRVAGAAECGAGGSFGCAGRGAVGGVARPPRAVRLPCPGCVCGAWVSACGCAPHLVRAAVALALSLSLLLNVAEWGSCVTIFFVSPPLILLLTDGWCSAAAQANSHYK
ncbi:uncharacterized protein Tco025E_10161 [Trypanosoma conorhini]|uniref:Uncharacterized protein n=1 Tax=Trypanosoma conorhini TaxID=83891 RepID=A0A3R7JQ89_9TRYP|nr:uncharacterized protein Tco025E_10161 [Trypanosoma conorhini]RNE95137.1 hypothetical protein Tco025E_10161 [Trypanosoma conorhini]